jgi:hypothetical protein
MSQEPQSTPVQLVTAAYLQEAEQPIDQTPEPAPDASLVMLTRITRTISFLFIGLLVVGVSWNFRPAWSAFSKEKARRTCAADWALWLAGSNETFQDKLNNSLEKSRREYEQQMEESRTKFDELKGFDVNQFTIQGGAFGGAGNSE